MRCCDLVDENLRQYRRGQAQNLQRQRDENQAGKRARQAVKGSRDRPKRQGAAQVRFPEIRHGPKFQSHSGEARIELFEIQPAAFTRRIQDQGPVLANVTQHHKVVQVPVQHARQLQLAKLVDFQPQRPTGQSQAFGRLHQRSKRVAAPGFTRERTRGREIQPQSVEVGDHR